MHLLMLCATYYVIMFTSINCQFSSKNNYDVTVESNFMVLAMSCTSCETCVAQVRVSTHYHSSELDQLLLHNRQQAFIRMTC